MRRLGKLVGAVHTAAAVVLFYFLCQLLAPAGARAATIVFAFGTCSFSVASQALWPHGPALFWLTLALFLLVSRGERDSAVRFSWIGFALGMAVATRPATALFWMATAAALSWRGRWQAVSFLAVGAALPCAALYAFNTHYFGQPVSGGYINLGATWTTPFGVGLAGLLIAPSRGLFVYTPAMLLVPFGVGVLRARQAGGGDFARGVMGFWFAGCVVTLLVFARSDWWSGGWSYGPRYLIECTPVLCALFAMAIGSPRFQSQFGKAVVTGLVSLSVAIHTIGVFSNDRGDWHRRHLDQLQLFELRDTQIESALRHLVGLKPAPNPRK
jgi:hypothetical protein